MVNVESQSLLVLKTSEDVPGRREWDAMGCCGRLRQLQSTDCVRRVEITGEVLEEQALRWCVITGEEQKEQTRTKP